MKLAVITLNRRKIFFLIICVFVFFLGFSITSQFITEFNKKALAILNIKLKPYFNIQLARFSIYPDAKYYFLLTESRDYFVLYTKGISWKMFFTILLNSLSNAFFQPVFLSVFILQTILYIGLFPFFVWGVVKYFKKVPFIVFGFFLVYFYIGLGSTFVESLIRHRLSCELVYLLIGIAGFINWITKELS